MRNVVLVSPSAIAGGAERALASLARDLPQHGWNASVVVLREGPLERWLAGYGVPVSTVDGGRVRSLHRVAAAVARIRRELRTRNADVVLANMTKGQIYAGAAGAVSHLPCVWWQHGVPGRDPLERAAALFPSTAVVCSTDHAMSAQRRLTPRRRIVKIPPGVDVDAIAERGGAGDAIRAEHGVTGPWIGIVGRLQPWKGQDVFLRAAAQIPDARFAVVGGALLGWEGSYPDDLRALAAELGIADRVDFVGHQEDAVAWLDAFDVVVHASVEEPFGLVVVEAMALGKPVVATRGGGPDEIVEDGVSGLLVDPRAPEQIADAIRSLLADPSRAEALGRAAAERARTFSEARTAERFAALLDEVAA